MTERSEVSFKKLRAICPEFDHQIRLICIELTTTPHPTTILSLFWTEKIFLDQFLDQKWIKIFFVPKIVFLPKMIFWSFWSKKIFFGQNSLSRIAQWTIRAQISMYLQNNSIMVVNSRQNKCIFIYYLAISHKIG